MIRPLCIALLLSGCASVEPRAVTGPSGGTAYTMTCSGGGLTMQDCFEAAGRACPEGYDIVAQGVASRGPKAGGALTIECR